MPRALPRQRGCLNVDCLHRLGAGLDGRGAYVPASLTRERGPQALIPTAPSSVLEELVGNCCKLELN